MKSSFLEQLKKSSYLLLLPFILLLPACGGGGGSETNPGPGPDPDPLLCGQAIPDATCKTIPVGAIGDRHFFFYEPATRADLAPVVIMLHGAPGSPMSVDNYLDGRDFADTNGYLAVFPQGQGNFAWSSSVAATSEISPDSQFVSAIIDDLISNHQADADQIFVAGFSAGGFMVYQLACEIPQKLTAAVAIAGQLRGSLQACNAPSPLAIHHIHGTNDNDVPSTGRADGIKSVDETLALWQAINNCDTSSEESESFFITPDNKTAVTISYQNCQAPLQYTRVNGGVHEQVYDIGVLHTLMQSFFSPTL